MTLSTTRRAEAPTAVWERSLRRAGLPIACSRAFTPHPKVSFTDALPVGVASTGEYAELTFRETFEVAAGMCALSASFPHGMRVLACQVVVDGTPKLATLLTTTLWEVVYPPVDGGVDAPPITIGTAVSALRRCGEAVLAADEATVDRRRPDGATSTVDLRPLIVPLHADARAPDPTTGTIGPPGPAPIIRALLSNDGPSVRPGDLHGMLAAHRAPTDPELGEPRELRRVAQGRVAEGGLREALTGDPFPLVPDDGAVALEEVAW